MSEKHQGKKYKPMSEEGKKNISKAKKGKKLSEEHKRKLKIARKRRKPYSKKTRLKMSKALKGKKCYAWKGGITPINFQIRNSIEFRLWREKVFTRDNWICQKCKIKNGMGKTIKLHSHHIRNFSQFPELRFTIDNGITFCRKCHKKFHKKYGIRNNNQKQLEEFLT